VFAIGSHKGLRTLHIGQEYYFIGLAVYLIQLGMAPLVGIGVDQEPVVIHKIMMTIGI
jgi:hypothetical protein